MRLKTPQFWYDTTTPAAKMRVMALSSLSGVYAIGHIAHQALTQAKVSPIPVICIGNLVAGGGGKTPTALAVMALIRAQALAKNPCFLSRGYGGTLSGPVLVDHTVHNAGHVGDEPLMLSHTAPTVITRDRLAGAQMAAQLGHDMIVMDDGLHNPGLSKNLSIVVIDGMRGFGNGYLIPAGPLRTSLKCGLAKADLFILIGDDHHHVEKILPPETPLIRATMKPTISRALHPNGYLAFCGIANPNKFRDSLKTAGIAPVDLVEFPDHHAYTARDIDNLRDRARDKGLRLITTAKDAVKLPGFISASDFDTLDITLEWPATGPATLLTAIQRMTRPC